MDYRSLATRGIRPDPPARRLRYRGSMNDAQKPVVDPGERCELCARVLHEVERRDRKGAARGRRPRSGPARRRLLGRRVHRRCASALGASRMLGVEIYEEPAQAAEARGIEVARVDLEAERFPWPDESVDVVICNQVLEHLKNIWLPMSEMHRVLRPGGHAVLSVPNLASLHNRVLLGARPPADLDPGFRPACARLRLERVLPLRREGRRLLDRDAAGAGFYPSPRRGARRSRRSGRAPATRSSSSPARSRASRSGAAHLRRAAQTFYGRRRSADASTRARRRSASIRSQRALEGERLAVALVPVERRLPQLRRRPDRPDDQPRRAPRGRPTRRRSR